MSDMVKYRAVSFKKDQIAALYFTMSDIVHRPFNLHPDFPRVLPEIFLGQLLPVFSGRWLEKSWVSYL